MNQKPNDGGPAFPRPSSELNNPNCAWIAQEGMSIRAHFAGQALKGMMVNGFMPDQAFHTNARFKSGKDTHYNYAAAAVEISDALISELSKETP